MKWFTQMVERIIEKALVAELLRRNATLEDEVKNLTASNRRITPCYGSTTCVNYGGFCSKCVRGKGDFFEARRN